MRFEDTNGNLHAHPLTKEHSREINDHLYTDVGHQCDGCEMINPTRYVIDDTCTKCLQGTFYEQEAELDKTQFIIDAKQCKGGPHFITRRKGYRKCVICEGIKAATPLSPRQAALSAGETWYTPATACKRCGTTALKRVADGRCQGCVPPKAPSVPHDRILPPDIIMGRATAKQLGFKVFRTGRYCSAGHNYFRYVSTGQCVQCHRGEQ